jgi:hypothetical protein
MATLPVLSILYFTMPRKLFWAQSVPMPSSISVVANKTFFMFFKCVSDVNICRYNEKVGKLVFFPTKKPLSGYLRLSFLSVDGVNVRF